MVKERPSGNTGLKQEAQPLIIGVLRPCGAENELSDRWYFRAGHNYILRGGSRLDPGFLPTIFIRNPWAADEHNYANGFGIARALE